MSEYLTEDKAAEHIGFSVSSLRKWRNHGIGPAYIQAVEGGGVRYTVIDLDKYMESKKVSAALTSVRP